MFTLYGIKNCDTVKKARSWLEQHAIAYQFHDVRADGLTLERLQDFTARVDWQLLLNRSSASWRQLTPEQKTDVTLEKAVQLLHDNPTLLKRPVLDTGEQLIVGFKIEDYQQFV
jgi:Spx/MgsR family transcriptional regulator